MKPRTLLIGAAFAALLASPALADTPATPSASSAAPAVHATMPPATSSTPSAASASTTRVNSTSASSSSTHAASTPASTSASHAASVNNTELYRRAQQKLKDLSFYSGAIDGTRNAAYVESLERFQREHHLHANGRLNAATRHALGI